MKRILYLPALTFILMACMPAPEGVDGATLAPATPTPTATETQKATETATAKPPTETPTPEIVEYPVSKEAKDFRESYIPWEALFDGKDGEVSSFVRYLKSLPSEPYDEASLKFVPLIMQGNYINYDHPEKIKIYPDPKERPFRRGPYGYTTYEGKDYFIAAIQYYVKGLDPKDYPWIIAISSIVNDKNDKILINYWAEMNFPVWIIDNIDPLSGETNPLVAKTFKDPKINIKIDDFLTNNDPAMLDGAVLTTIIARGVNHPFE